MIQHCTGDDVAAEVLMIRSTFKGTIIIVEGDDDCRVYEKFVNPRLCQMQPAYGRPNALEAMSLLSKPKGKGIVAIVDADFWHHHGTKPPSRNVLVTDFHDIEIMMFGSRAFDAIMAEYGSVSKIEKFLGLSGTTSLRIALMASVISLGLLRLISEEDGLALKFKGLDFNRVVEKSTLQLSTGDLVCRVLMLTENPRLNRKDILRKLQKAQSKAHDPWHICSGHDVAVIVGIGLRKALGNKSKDIGNGENIERLLRLSYDSSDFRSTRLFKRAKKWEKANTPFTIFSL